MAEMTKIEWCDSTLNLMMGCDGCELSSNIGHGTCYAETLTARRSAGKGNPGWPRDFFTPQLFEHRLEPALRWPDLTGKPRPEKPWLDGMPRVIFLDDLGDTFTESLPFDWIIPHLPKMSASPHIWLFLTKRPKRMAACFRAYGSVPLNFWLGTSCTDNTQRLLDLTAMGGPSLWVSAEPLVGELKRFRLYASHLAWAVVGGESGAKARPLDLAWVRAIRDVCLELGIPLFVKQLGRLPFDGFYTPAELAMAAPGIPRPDGSPLLDPRLVEGEPVPRWLGLRDLMGGDMAEWPADLRIRQMPVAA